MPHALIVDDDSGFQAAVSEVIKDVGFSIDHPDCLSRARNLIELRPPDIALVDLSLPDGRGTELFGDLADADVVMITANASLDSAVQALREGASDYLMKPVDTTRLRAILANVAKRSELREEVDNLRGELRELGRFGSLVGSSAPMQELYDAISRVAPTNASVLIQGESGTGKELIAETVHRLSRRRKQRFVALNCGAVSPQLIESELFGHEKGSFTGASRTHKGYFERAAGGTLFLDEITEMAPELQVKLLRALETGRVTRVGAEQDVEADVRIIAATNRDPQKAVESGTFRQDLLYRLAVFPVIVPPLRDRGADVDLLAEFFLSELNRAERTSKHFAPEALAELRHRDWLGNVRELKNVVERAFIMADEVIEAECIPPSTGTVSIATVETSPTNGSSVRGGPVIEISPGTSIDEAERRLIIATLEAFNGNKEKAAGVLQISLKTLYNRLNEYKYEGPGRVKSARSPTAH
ncbi:MAG: sigma-54-dependent Fis family transcriptional regulator [Deltaproteobacteria bacterium]|nr:sigma-54-dependent Fis family transcriptional regulator [Deltaproteobacteria bacterium]